MFLLDDVKMSFGRNLALSTDRVEFHAGTAVALMGPNGAGKTTLLSVLAGLLTPTSGQITNRQITNGQVTNGQVTNGQVTNGQIAGTAADGVAIEHAATKNSVGAAADGAAAKNSIDTAAEHAATKPSVGYVAQEARQLVSLTAGEIIKMGRYRSRGLLGRLRKSDREMLAMLAQKLQVSDLLTKPFGALSGGQRQRVRVAAALANDADCLLLDEPITGLDLLSQEIIFEVIAAERAKARLVMMSTHNIDEARRCDRVLLMNTTIVADGSPTEVLTEPNLRAAFGERLVSSVPQAPALALLDGHGHQHDHDGHGHQHDHNGLQQDNEPAPKQAIV